MKTLISSLFIVIMIVVLITMGAQSLRDSLAAEIEEIGSVLEDRKLNKRIMSKVKRAPSRDLRSIVTDVLVMDVSLLKEWLETRSALPEDQRRRQICGCQETMVKQRHHYSTMFEGMSDKAILKLFKEHISEHDTAWRRRLLSRLEGRA